MCHKLSYNRKFAVLHLLWLVFVMCFLSILFVNSCTKLGTSCLTLIMHICISADMFYIPIIVLTWIYETQIKYLYQYEWQKKKKNAITIPFETCSCANGGGGVCVIYFQVFFHNLYLKTTFILKQRITSCKLGYMLNWVISAGHEMHGNWIYYRSFIFCRLLHWKYFPLHSYLFTLLNAKIYASFIWPLPDGNV